MVLLPGLWTPGWAMIVLARRLDRLGFTPRVFTYPTVRRDLCQNAALLARYLDRIPETRVHLVGFSLGGLVIRAFVRDFGAVRIHRAVMMGTPNAGSEVARRVGRWRMIRPLLGRGIAMLLEGVPAQWAWSEVELGLIAGVVHRRGRIHSGEPVPNDGLVSVDEVWLDGAQDRIVVPASHSGLLFSKGVAERVACFLHTGCFDASSLGFTPGR
ncbi:MAG: esterase/lipase family protein [Acidiferrobacteraceae bacterium]